MWDTRTIRIEVLAEFVEAQRRGRRHHVEPYLRLIERQSNPARRAVYEYHRYLRTTWYRMMLEGARRNSTRRRIDPTRRAESIRCERARHTVRREAEVAGRVCPECAGSVTLTARYGRVRKFCSRRCAHRVASRAWWHHQEQARKLALALAACDTPRRRNRDDNENIP